MPPLPRNVLHYGLDQALPEQRALRAGPWTLLFENGDLRYVRLGRREVLRRVYVAVRDRNWGTVPLRLSDLRFDAGPDRFHVTFQAEHRQGDIDFAWTGTIHGEGSTITFTMDGEARSTFWRNRVGFCVLHPFHECAGCRCTVEKADGSVEEGTFPRLISPQAPFKDIRAISHEVLPGVWADVRFAGDVFEMEDQRNWTDASYKTFCTPLAQPYPVEVRQGTRVSQSVTLRLRGTVPQTATQTADAELTFMVGDAVPRRLPRIGLGVASHGQPLRPNELPRLEALHLSHLRVDVRPAQPGFEERLQQAWTDAGALGVPLEPALFLSPEPRAELDALSRALEAIRPTVAACLVLPADGKVSTAALVQSAGPVLRHRDPRTRIGAGTNADFLFVNRAPLPLDLLDFVAYSINPQVHAPDNDTLVENLAAQAETVESARRLAGGKPLAVTPVTLKPRWNPYATGAAPEPVPGELPPQVDVRQMSLFGAAWTLGSLKYLAEAGVESVTYYETTGWRGVMETEAGSPLPKLFRSIPGAVFPLYHVLADIGEFAGGDVLPSVSSEPLRFDGLTLRRGGQTRVLLASFRPEPLRVSIRGLGTSVRLWVVDASNAEEAMQAPEAFRARPGEERRTANGCLDVELPPYAVVRIDAGEEAP